MSYAGYATPLRIEPRPSRWLAAAILFVYGGAVLMTLLVPLSRWLAVPTAVAIAGAGWRTFVDRVLMSRAQAIIAVVWRDDGRWELQTRDGRRLPVALLPDSYVHPWLTVLNFRGAARRRSVVLLPDSLDSQCYRRLRVRLGIDAGVH